MTRAPSHIIGVRMSNSPICSFEINSFLTNFVHNKSIRIFSKQMEWSMKTIISFLQNEEGATAIEYGLIAALISVVIIGAVQLIGGNLTAKFGQIATALS
jgi:pilus assembly protein Flp/PilA